MSENEIGSLIVDCSYRVHKNLGPGLLESSYEACLLYELKESGHYASSQKALPIIYNEVKLNAGYRIDIIVEEKVILEIKSLETFNNVHLAQVITYLKLSKCKLGYLINFNVKYFKEGVKRVVNKLEE
jgi:GxxExxY protein